MELFPFQKQCVKDLRKGFEKNLVQALAWYTGAGKTNVFVMLCKDLVQENPQIKIGISAYLTTEIRDQIQDRLKEFGLGPVSHTIHGAKFPNNKNIYVFNPQSVYRKDLQMKFDYFIVDESHAGTAEDCRMINRILERATTVKTKILLVSATPWDTLAQERFKDIPVFKRPLDQGMADGLVTDFRFHAEEAAVTFTAEDFNRQGDLGRNATMREMAVLKSACIGKMKYLIENYDKEIGKKCLVICPPGNFGEIARSLADLFDSRALLQFEEHRHSALEEIGFHNTRGNLEKFKVDSSRFLFVIHKCQVGFDMTELNSVIDLTMSRNIKALAQRCGRVARKNGSQQKHYFYVYDTSLMKDRLEWLITTMIDFCLGAYDGWTTRTAKYAKPKTLAEMQWTNKNPISITIKEVIDSLKNHTQNVRTLSYVTGYGPPTKWSLERAVQESSKWSSRTEMWSKQPALYKWFRLNAKAEMDRIFPIKNNIGKWNEESIIAEMKKFPKRTDFHKKAKGAADWVNKNNRQDLVEKYLLPPKFQKWTKERAMAELSKIKVWSETRNSGLRHWMQKNPNEKYWQEKWTKLTSIKIKNRRPKSN